MCILKINENIFIITELYLDFNQNHGLQKILELSFPDDGNRIIAILDENKFKIENQNCADIGKYNLEEHEEKKEAIIKACEIVKHKFNIVNKDIIKAQLKQILLPTSVSIAKNKIVGGITNFVSNFLVDNLVSKPLEKHFIDQNKQEEFMKPYELLRGKSDQAQELKIIHEASKALIKYEVPYGSGASAKALKPANDNYCPSGKGVCYAEAFGPGVQEQKLGIKPKIEFFARDVDLLAGKAQHGYTIFTFSDGKKIIVTGFPEKNNMITGNLHVVVTEYTETNAKNHIFPEKDFDANLGKITQRQSRFAYSFKSDEELNKYLSKAKEASNYINHGNNGKRFDYDLCVSDSCWGSNSNTVQSYIYKQMGLELKIPKDINLPGINGNFYNGPMDDLIKKWGEELQKEQP